MGFWRTWRQSGGSIERSISRASRFQLHERLVTSAARPSRRGGSTATFARWCSMGRAPLVDEFLVPEAVRLVHRDAFPAPVIRRVLLIIALEPVCLAVPFEG